MRLIDPPSGWIYGFPKPFDPKQGQSTEVWLIDNGYPAHEVANWPGGVPCRIWRADAPDPEHAPE
ncbi:MAG: hypothetical protein ABIS51_23375 [Sphingomonas sp.]